RARLVPRHCASWRGDHNGASRGNRKFILASSGLTRRAWGSRRTTYQRLEKNRDGESINSSSIPISIPCSKGYRGRVGKATLGHLDSVMKGTESIASACITCRFARE